jgi:fucose permease
VGALPADRIAGRLGAKVTVAAGFALMAAGTIVGATTNVGSSQGFIAAWLVVSGAGMGLGMATAASAALRELPAEESGVGSGVMQALQKIGAPLGVAILGSVLSSGYHARLNLDGLPGAAAAAVREGLFGGIQVATQLGSASLLRSVREAFVHGMDLAFVVSAGIAVAGIVLALVFMPRRAMRKGQPVERVEEEREVVVS